MDSVLIVDDDPGALLLIKTILSNKEYRLVTAANGEEAKLLLEKEPDQYLAVILDWDMPKMNGIELLTWIKAQPALEDIPVVMQTAMDSTEQIREGIDAGAFYYLTKPFDKDLLHSVVRAALMDSRSKRALLRKLKQSENPFELMTEGTFMFRNLSEGERIAVWIANACSSPTRAMQITELITNAIEHGNLGITYDEKTEFVSNGTWAAEVERRLTLPEHQKKMVSLTFNRHAHGVTVLIEDEGPGFDYSRYMRLDESRVFDNHGRGIALAGSVLDLQFLGRGNRVLITIRDEKPENELRDPERGA
jgi:DNA-binding response OmpR family regulator